MDRTPLRIGFFSDTYRPYISGAVRSMELFAQGLRARGHSVVIFAPSYPGYSGAREQGVVRLPSLPLPGYPHLRLTLPLVETLTGQVTGFDLDVVHCHSPFAVGFLGLAVARQMETPALFSCHSLYEEYVRSHMPWAPTSFRRLVRRYTVDFCNLTDAVVAPSVFTREFLIEAGVSVPVRTIPTGIVIQEADGTEGQGTDAGDGAGANASTEAARFHDVGGPAEAEMAASRETIRLGWTAAVGRHTRFLLFVGRLSKEKNLSFLVDALSELVAAGRDYYLIIVGDGPDRLRVAAQAEKMGLARRVVFTGALIPSQVQQFYRAADVFVFASPHETQGLVLLEAMANGLPVVAVDSPASSELTGGGDSGLLVPADPSQMAAAVRRVAETPEVSERLGQRGRERAAQFSTTAMTAHLEDFYYELIDQHSGQKPAEPDFSFSPR